MDESPERGVLAPEARDLEGLAEELEDGLVLEREGRVEGYVGLYPFWDGAALEGPLAYRKEDLPALLQAAEARALELGVERLYAFPQEANRPLREVLEAAGYDLLHTTYFFVKNPKGLDYPPPKGVRIKKGFPGAEVYRELYRESEEGWALRLKWTDEELEEHFAEPHVHLLVAYQGEEPVGMAEVEVEGNEASVAYIGVVPKARGQGIGRALLAEAARLAEKKGARSPPGPGPRPRDRGPRALPQPGLQPRGGRGHLRQGAQGQAVGGGVGLHGEAGVAVVPPAHDHHQGHPQGPDQAENAGIPPLHALGGKGQPAEAVPL
jgi:GNAT superfamily N-acetyltransferase